MAHYNAMTREEKSMGEVADVMLLTGRAVPPFELTEISQPIQVLSAHIERRAAKTDKPKKTGRKAMKGKRV